MKAADHHRHAIGTERAGDIERARVLIRLHPDDADQAESVVTPKQGAQLLDLDAGVDLVDDRDVDRGVGPEHGAEPRIPSEAVQHGERVRRNERPHPLDDIAIVVVMRRLDQNELKPSRWPRRCTRHQFTPPPGALAGRFKVSGRNPNTILPCEKRPPPAPNGWLADFSAPTESSKAVSGPALRGHVPKRKRRPSRPPRSVPLVFDAVLIRCAGRLRPSGAAEWKASRWQPPAPAASEPARSAGSPYNAARR